MTMQHAHPLDVVLAGAGGFGRLYLSRLRQLHQEGRIHVRGIIDPMPPTDNPDLQALVAAGAGLHQSLEEYYRRESADLACVCTPIPTHRRLTEIALTAGSHVLCEKPAAALATDVEAMISTRDRAQRQVAVGFQWSFADEIVALKRRIMDGEFGRPRRLRVLVKWPRSRQYYQRAAWAGRLRLDNGDWVLDGSAANAHSHFLHNMLYMLGDRLDTSAVPRQLQAELYRANPIESYDTVALRILCENDAEILFYSTHASDPERGEFGPHCVYEFEKANLIRHDRGAIGFSPFRIERSDAPVESLPPDSDLMKKLQRVLEFLCGEGDQYCGLEAALPQVLCINAMHLSCPEIGTLPDIRTTDLEGQHWTWSPAAEACLDACFKTGSLPSEAGPCWTVAGQVMDVQNLDLSTLCCMPCRETGT